MPTKLNEFSLFLALQGFERALKLIKQADGYNTSPHVEMGFVSPDDVPDGQYPFLCFEGGDLQPNEQLWGGPSQGLVRFGWPIAVTGYVRESASKRSLYGAGLALMADVYSGIYGNETLTDGAGVGTVLFVEPGAIIFDMDTLVDSNTGLFVAEFTLVVDLERGSTQ